MTSPALAPISSFCRSALAVAEGARATGFGGSVGLQAATSAKIETTARLRRILLSPFVLIRGAFSICGRQCELPLGDQRGKPSECESSDATKPAADTPEIAAPLDAADFPANQAM